LYPGAPVSNDYADGRAVNKNKSVAAAVERLDNRHSFCNSWFVVTAFKRSIHDTAAMNRGTAHKEGPDESGHDKRREGKR